MSGDPKFPVRWMSRSDASVDDDLAVGFMWWNDITAEDVGAHRAVLSAAERIVGYRKGMARVGLAVLSTPVHRSSHDVPRALASRLKRGPPGLRAGLRSSGRRGRIGTSPRPLVSVVALRRSLSPAGS